ncbi:MAG: class I SAM-dependent methyltransferase [Acidimicrobiia bacterium]|nr:class I SAM-dependent methyltransferase [Acidimicrobiia bacterium]
MISNNEYYELTIEHRNQHKCGGYPFENGQFLTDIVQELRSENILEIGTSIGYSTNCFARAFDTVKITTIDKDKTHCELATKNFKENNVIDQVEILFGVSGKIIKDLKIDNKKYDIIFFDGFSPNPDEVDDYIELLNNSGLLITTNLELPSKIYRVDEYLDKILKLGSTTIRFGDIAFSSKDKTKLEICKKLWGST